MRNCWHLGMVAFLAVLPAANAADASGTWKGAFDFQGSNVPLTFHFHGCGWRPGGNGRRIADRAAELHDGKVAGSTVKFWVNTDYQGQTYKLLFKGTVSAAGIRLTSPLERRMDPGARS